MRALLAALAAASLAAPAHGHLKVYYAPEELAVRNAPSSTSDGSFSVDTVGCGGVNDTEWGINGVSTLVAGDILEIWANYGTGVEGDHADDANVLYATWSANGLDSEVLDLSNAMDSVDAPAGSRVEPYVLTVNVPWEECERCTLAVVDQRDWSGCYDVEVKLADPTRESSAASIAVAVLVLSAVGVIMMGVLVYRRNNANSSPDGQRLRVPTASTSGDAMSAAV